MISFHSLEDRRVKQFIAAASKPFGGDPALARLPLRSAELPSPPLLAIGRAQKPSAAEVARNPRARSAVLRVAERSHAPLAGGLAEGAAGDLMTRVNVVLLLVLVACALSLVTSRNQARRLFVELTREQGQARAYETEYGQLSLEQSTWGMPARVEKIARDTLRMQLPAAGRVEVVEIPAAIAPVETKR